MRQRLLAILVALGEVFAVIDPADVLLWGGLAAIFAGLWMGVALWVGLVALGGLMFSFLVLTVVAGSGRVRK